MMDDRDVERTAAYKEKAAGFFGEFVTRG